MDRVELHRWSCTRRSRGTFYGGSWGKTLLSFVALIPLLILQRSVWREYVSQLWHSAGLPVCVWRHAGFCIHQVEASPLGIWHWWVSLWRQLVQLMLAASLVILCANAQTWQTKPVVACRFQSHASEPLWKYSVPSLRWVWSLWKLSWALRNVFHKDIFKHLSKKENSQKLILRKFDFWWLTRHVTKLRRGRVCAAVKIPQLVGSCVSAWFNTALILSQSPPPFLMSCTWYWLVLLIFPLCNLTIKEGICLYVCSLIFITTWAGEIRTHGREKRESEKCRVFNQEWTLTCPFFPG